MTIDRRTIPVTIRGRTYPSYTAAAADLGVTREAISMAKRRGLLDTVGLHSGENARDVYLRRVMSDGKWRNMNDLLNRASSDGMKVTTQGVGRSMARLVREGCIRSEGDDDRRMWKLRAVRLEAAE